jgi:hypothetical protein
VRTNFVVFTVARDRTAFLDALARERVLMVAYPHGQVRAVTHYGVDEADIETTIGAVRRALAATSGSLGSGVATAATSSAATSGTAPSGAATAPKSDAAAAPNSASAAAVAR